MSIYDELDLLDQAQSRSRAGRRRDGIRQRRRSAQVRVPVAGRRRGDDVRVRREGAGPRRGGGGGGGRGAPGSRRPSGAARQHGSRVVDVSAVSRAARARCSRRHIARKGVAAFARQPFAWNAATPGAFHVRPGERRRCRRPTRRSRSSPRTGWPRRSRRASSRRRASPRSISSGSSGSIRRCSAP